MASKDSADSLPYFPPELVDVVCQWVKANGDVKLLADMSQLSRDYHPRLQKLIWEHIDLHPGDTHCGQFKIPSATDQFAVYDTTEKPKYSNIKLDGSTDSWFDRALKRLFEIAVPTPYWTDCTRLTTSLCLTVTNKTPHSVWNAILSLPNLEHLSVIGDTTMTNKNSGQHSHGDDFYNNSQAVKIKSLRLRGYAIDQFVRNILTGCAKTLRFLDLGLLERPRFWSQNGETYAAAPQAYELFSGSDLPAFESLERLILCKGGPLANPGDWGVSQQRNFGFGELRVYRKWEELLKSVRETIVNIHFDLRPIFDEKALEGDGTGIPRTVQLQDTPEDGLPSVDENFCTHIIGPVFYGGGEWPRLKELTLQGFHVTQNGFRGIFGRSWDHFLVSALPEVKISTPAAYSMFVQNREKRGMIINSPGIDGLRAEAKRVEDVYWDDSEEGDSDLLRPSDQGDPEPGQSQLEHGSGSGVSEPWDDTLGHHPGQADPMPWKFQEGGSESGDVE